MNLNADIIIIGGGIIGIGCGYYLSQAGHKVVVVEKASIGSGTSARSFFWANASTKNTDAPYHHLNALGVRLYRSLADHYGAKRLGIHSCGALGIVRASDPVGYTATRDKAARLTALGYPNLWLDNAALRAAEPDLVFPDDAEALFTPDDKIIHARKVMRFFAEEIRAKGGVLIENCTAQEIRADEDGTITGLNSSLGTITAPKILLSAGPDTAQLLAELTGFDGYSRFPVTKAPGLLVTTPPLSTPRPVHIIYTESGTALQFQPDVGGGVRMGSDETDGLILQDQSPENLRRIGQELLGHVQHFVPGLAAEAVIDQSALDIGIRPYPEDGKTIAGALPGANGLFVVATHSGITLAPALGKLMAQTIATGTVPDMLRPFGLDRLAGMG